MKIVSLRAGCATGATQKPLCKRTNETLRIGCPHCGPRAGRCGTPPAGCCASGENEKKPAGKCTFLPVFFYIFIAPVGSLAFVPQSACGKKFGKAAFFIAERVQGRWPCCGVQGPHRPLLRCFFSYMQKEDWKCSPPHRRKGAGAAHAPAPPFLKLHAENHLKKQSSSSHVGCRANGPAAGGAGSEPPPAPLFPKFRSLLARRCVFVVLR